MKGRIAARSPPGAMSCNPADALQHEVASLVVVRASGSLDDRQRRYPQWELNNEKLKRLLQRGVGGVILLGGSAVELQQRTRTRYGICLHTCPRIELANFADAVNHRKEPI